MADRRPRHSPCTLFLGAALLGLALLDLGCCKRSRRRDEARSVPKPAAEPSPVAPEAGEPVREVWRKRPVKQDPSPTMTLPAPPKPASAPVAEPPAVAAPMPEMKSWEGSWGGLESPTGDAPGSGGASESRVGEAEPDDIDPESGAGTAGWRD